MAFNKLKDLFKKKNVDEELESEDLFEPEIIGKADENARALEEGFEAGLENQEIQELDFSDLLLDDASENNLTISSEEGNDKDYSDMEKAINELMQEDAATDVVDVNYDYINDVSVYDTVRHDKEAVVQDLKEELLEEVNQKNEEELLKEKRIFNIFIIVIFVLVFFIIAASATLGIIVLKNGGISALVGEQKPVNKVISASQTDFTSNSGNYIFLKQEKMLGDKKIKLSKMLADPVATVFYFNTYLDTQKYNFVLTDDNDKFYAMDLYFVENNKAGGEDVGETVVRFQAMNPSAKLLMLSIRDNETGEIAEFNIKFEEKLVMSPVKYLKKPIEVNTDNYNIKITNAILASSGTSIEYLIDNPKESKYKITQGLKSNSNYINFEQGSTNKLKKKEIPEVYTFDDGKKVIGRMDFAPVSNLEDKYYVTLTDIYKKYDVNTKVLASSVSSEGETKTQTIDVDNYRIVFEGLGAFNDKYVFVFHGEDKNAKIDPKNPMSNRVEVLVDAQLVGTTDTGMEVILDGKCTAAQRGTDMIFPVDEKARDFIYGVSRDKLKVEIKSILIKEENIKIPLNYTQFYDSKSSERKTFEESVENAFEARLKYKSERSSVGAITGFSDEVINDTVLMEDYKPTITDSKPHYSAQVISAEITGDKASAVVQDTWIGLNNSVETHFYRKHKIKAERTKIGWIITEDKVIQ